jgi:subtilase family serine protease
MTVMVSVYADTDNSVAESNETNNCRVSNVECPVTEVLYANDSGWWREGGAFNQSDTPIQAAIDNSHSSCGATIYVAAGMYHEQVIKIR